MWRKLRSPVSSIIRRQLLSKSDNIPQSQISLTFCSYFHWRREPRVYQIQTSQLLANPKFFLRYLCSSSIEKASCWNCNAVAGSSRPFLICHSCRAAQPLYEDSYDYSLIFSLENKLDINDEILEGKYKDGQKKLYPDLVHSKSKEEREYAAEQSAQMKLAHVEVDEEQTVSESKLLSESNDLEM